jgi:hypothetical protein
MRSAKVSGAALLALGAGAALWVWRNPRAREQAQRLLGDARATLRDANIPARLDHWRVATFRGLDDQLPGPQEMPGVLDRAGENLTITQRVRTNLGREPMLADLPHINVNTEGRGVVYLRGYAHSDEQRRVAATVAANTEGVTQVVNELNIEQAVNL